MECAFMTEDNHDYAGVVWMYLPLTWRQVFMDSYHGIREEIQDFQLESPETSFHGNIELMLHFK
jgi:hypothetical protein